MSLKDNKQVVTRFFDAVMRADIPTLSDLLAPNAEYWVAPSTLFSGTYTRQAMLDLMPEYFGSMEGNMTFTVGEMTAEEDRVSVMAQGHARMKSGKEYANTYHFLFRVQGGKLILVKEYFDSQHVNEIFGRQS
jgi:ketosteroid isomerase-like protein